MQRIQLTVLLALLCLHVYEALAQVRPGEVQTPFSPMHGLPRSALHTAPQPPAAANTDPEKELTHIASTNLPGTGGTPAEIIRVACVGDSITVGQGSGDNTHLSYPAQLQDMLTHNRQALHSIKQTHSQAAQTSNSLASEEQGGGGLRFVYQVEKFAVSGASVLKDTSLSIWDQPVLQQAISFKPHIVILLFGTNDAKQNAWDAETFMADYIALIDLFITHVTPITDINAPIKQHKMAFFLGVPPPIIGNAQAKPSAAEAKQWGIREDIISKTYPALFPSFVQKLWAHVATAPKTTKEKFEHKQSNIVAEYKLFDVFNLLGGHDKKKGQ